MESEPSDIDSDISGEDAANQDMSGTGSNNCPLLAGSVDECESTND